jgi:hypothetical protein
MQILNNGVKLFVGVRPLKDVPAETTRRSRSCRKPLFQGFEAGENLVVLAAQCIVLSFQRPRVLFGSANEGEGDASPVKTSQVGEGAISDIDDHDLHSPSSHLRVGRPFVPAFLKGISHEKGLALE